MNVAFFVGEKSDRLINSIKSHTDNVSFFTYRGINDMIRESTMRHIFFDRIVFYEKVMVNPEEELRALNSYVVEYSDNTKIVMVCNRNSTRNVELFSSMFDSPLYTPVIVDTLTIKDIVNFVKSDILELKASYYSLDVKKSSAVVGSYAEKGNQNPQSQTVNGKSQKKEKKGLFGGLFGGKKNKSGNVQNQINAVEDVINAQETVQNGVNQVAENTVKEVVSDVSEGFKSTMDGFTPRNNSDSGSSFYEESPVPRQYKNNELEYENSFESNSGGEDDFDLSVGDLGSKHADTGFLDEEEELELENAIRRELEKQEDEVVEYKEGSAEDDPRDVEYNYDYSEDEEEEEDGGEDYSYEDEEEEESISEDETLDLPNFRIVSGLRGSGVTTYIVDSAVKLSDSGKKVLIIDLDTKECGVLSLLDIESFYAKRCDCGLNKGKVYSEDGVDILSNGYGVSLNSDILERLSSLTSKYDVIFVDCPLDNIGVLPIDLIMDGAVMIRARGDKQSLLRIVNTLTSREVMSPEVEDVVFERSKFYFVSKPDTFIEDVNYIKDFCFFGRGNWADKLV